MNNFFFSIEENACFGTFQYDQIDSNPKYQLRKDKFLVPILLWGPNNQVRFLKYDNPNLKLLGQFSAPGVNELKNFNKLNLSAHS